MTDERPTHLDLFTGIGGFTIAAAAAGFRTVAFSEIEPYACQVLAERFPGIPNLGDIRGITGNECGRVDLITGGFPCQPYSVAGKRRGAQDDRAIWPEMLRVIKAFRPAWVLGENVAGIVAMELDRVLSDLEGIGYACRAFVIPACAVDARHRRDRVWIVSHRDGGRCEIVRQQEHAALEGARGDESDGLCAARRRGGEIVANSDKTGWQEQRRPVEIREECHSAERRGHRLWQSEQDWFAQSGMGRVAHGIPARSHRLRGLGNAIVPQVAAEILRAIAEMT